MNDTQENKNYVTPYAFGVDDAIAGKALASPTRRLFSIFIDTLVVGLLTLMSTTAMAVCVCIVSIVGSVKARRRDARDGTQSLAPRVLSVAAVLSAIVVAVSLLISNLSFDIGLPWSSDTSVVAEEQTKTESEGKATEIPETLSILAWLKAALADLGLGFGWAALYFSAFTAWFHGQTLGKILFRIRVVKIDGNDITLWESFGRYGGYSAGLATGLMGFLQIFWDPNRQAIHDKISETVVIDLRKPDLSI